MDNRHRHTRRRIMHKTAHLMDQAGLNKTMRTCERKLAKRHTETRPRADRTARHIGRRAISRDHEEGAYTQAGEPGIRTEYLHEIISNSSTNRILEEVTAMPGQYDMLLDDVDPAAIDPRETEKDVTDEDDEELTPGQHVTRYHDDRNLRDTYIKEPPKRAPRPVDYDPFS